MAEGLDAVGEWIGGLFANHGSAEKPYTEFYQTIGGQTHLVRYELDAKGKPTGSPKDMGVAAPKANRPILIANADGSKSLQAINPDGSAGAITQVSPPKRTDAPTATSGSTNVRNTASANYYDAKVAQLASPEYIAGLKAKNDKYVADTQKIYDEIKNADDLEPARKEALLAAAKNNIAKAGIAPSTILKNEAAAGKLDAQTNKILQDYWAQVQPQIEAIHAAQTAGNMTPEQAQQAIDGVVHGAVQQAVTGMNATQRDISQRARETNAVSQANSRASTAANYLTNTFNTTAKMASTMAPGKGDIAANGFQAMLSMAPGFLNSMGAAPVDIHPEAANMPVSPESRAAIMADVAGGMDISAAIAKEGQKVGAMALRSGPQNAAQITPTDPTQGQQQPGQDAFSNMKNAPYQYEMQGAL